MSEDDALRPERLRQIMAPDYAINASDWGHAGADLREHATALLVKALFSMPVSDRGKGKE